MTRQIRILTFFLFMAPLSFLSAQSVLTIEILNLESNKGLVLVDLMDKNEETVRDTTFKILDQKCTIIFKDLKSASYAIRYFHDENENDELDTKFLGIPKEGFGFSNDAMGRFGPKDFSEWIFEVAGDTHITMTTKYMF